MPRQSRQQTNTREEDEMDRNCRTPNGRREFLRGAVTAGAAVAGATLGATTLLARDKDHDGDNGHKKPTKEDVRILVAAEIAEALAVTTYTNIITTAPFFTRLADDDQGYLQAARQEEMSHYLLELSASGQPSPFTTFFFPFQMFESAQVTLNTLVTLEDAFIAAYLVGVRQFSSDDLRVTAARIMGIESDHRTLARVVGPGVALADGGPIELITGAQGHPESVDPPNNNGYERTLGWTQIEQAIDALLPFADPAAAQQAGFDTSRPYTFVSFTPVLPSPFGAFGSFTG
jgi:hypothetical protein